MYYSTASSGEIVIGEKFIGAEYQIHFPGQTSSDYYVCASMFAKGSFCEIGFQYYFDINGRLIKGSQIHTNKDSSDILSITRRPNAIAHAEFQVLRNTFSSILAQGIAKVKPQYRTTIEAVCGGHESLFRS